VLFAVSGRLPPFMRPTVLLMIGAAGAALRWAAMAFDPPAPVLPWLQLLHALSFGATHLGALGFVARHAPAGQGATAQGHLAIALGVAMAAATGLSGWLYGAFGGSGAEIINHSCDPNLRSMNFKGHILYMSRRAIRRGEELTVDYRFAKDIERVKCRCGARSCRGVINLPK